MIPIRTPVPRPPRFGRTFMMGAALAAGIALLPQISHSNIMAPHGSYTDLGTPVAQIISMRAPAWTARPGDYRALPNRDERLNALLNNAVEVLTKGEAVESRDRLNALQASLRQTARSLRSARAQLTVTADNPCAAADIGFNQITCRFETTRSEQAASIRDLQGTLQQRQQQILAERDRFAADLQHIGINVRPDQVSSLMRMATANDIVSLHAVYANLRDINAVLQQAAAQDNASPASVRRYYGIYTVLLEVGLHMHEDIYFKLRNTYLPRLDALALETAEAYKQARALSSTTTRADLKAQLESNIASLTTTMRAAVIYRQSLEAQAKAINASWERLYEQHQVAVNSFSAASLSADLLSEMQESGRHVASLSQLDIPPINAIGNAALQREFERLTLEIQLPNS